MAASSIEEAIVTYIKTLANVTSYIGTGTSARLYFMDAGTNETMPYIVFSTLSSPNEPQSLSKKSGQPMLSFSIFHNNKQNGLDLANNLLDGLNLYSGTTDGYTVVYLTATGPTALRDPDYDNIFQYVINAYIEYDRS